MIFSNLACMLLLIPAAGAAPLTRRRSMEKQGKATSHRYLKSGKGKGKGKGKGSSSTSPDVEPETEPIMEPEPETEVEPVEIDELSGSNDGTLIEHICGNYATFDAVAQNSTSSESGRIFGWSDHCDAVDNHHFLCPNAYETLKICSSNATGSSAAAMDEYCMPLVQSLGDDQMKHSCSESCVKFVSKEHGDCCDLQCMN